MPNAALTHGCKALVLSTASPVAILAGVLVVMAAGSLRCAPGDTRIMTVSVSGRAHRVPVFCRAAESTGAFRLAGQVPKVGEVRGIGHAGQGAAPPVTVQDRQA